MSDRMSDERIVELTCWVGHTWRDTLATWRRMAESVAGPACPECGGMWNTASVVVQPPEHDAAEAADEASDE